MEVVREFLVVLKKYDEAQTLFKKAMDQNKKGKNFRVFIIFYVCINNFFSDFENAIKEFRQKIKTRLNFSKIIEINENGKLLLLFLKHY